MRWTTFSFILAIVLSIGIIGCEGPQGPEGPQGSEGEEGPQGNANVTSIEVPADSISWKSGSYLGRPASVDTITTDSLDQDIIDHGAVLGYFQFNGAWYQLPSIWENYDGSLTQYVQFTFRLNNIILYAYDTDGEFSPDLDYRFLLVTDKTVTSKTKGGSQTDFEDLDNSNYYQVMDYFGLEY